MFVCDGVKNETKNSFLGGFDLLIELEFFIVDNNNSTCIMRTIVQAVMKVTSMVLVLALEMMVMLLGLDTVFQLLVV